MKVKYVFSRKIVLKNNYNERTKYVRFIICVVDFSINHVFMAINLYGCISQILLYSLQWRRYSNILTKLFFASFKK